VYRRRNLLREKLRQLDDVKAQERPTQTSPPTEALTASGVDNSDQGELTRRGSVGPKYSTNLSNEESEIASIGKAIEAGNPLDSEQIEAFRRVLNTEITILDEELRGKCTTTDNVYPNNLTFYNFVEWACLPTLVYDLEYPRQERINWWYVAEKSAATLGVIWIMIIISQAYIYPVVVETMRHKEAGMSLDERWKEFPWVGKCYITMRLSNIPLMISLYSIRHALPSSPRTTAQLVRHMGVPPKRTGRSHTICRPRLLRRMVELRILRSIRSRLEPTGPQLPASTCLPLLDLVLPSI